MAVNLTSPAGIGTEDVLRAIARLLDAQGDIAGAFAQWVRPEPAHDVDGELEVLTCYLEELQACAANALVVCQALQDNRRE